MTGDKALAGAYDQGMTMTQQPMVTGRRHMVVAGHYLATEAGAQILAAGGNAIDAGVAAGIALGVLHSDQVQFSGVAPMLIYLAERDAVVSIAGLGAWPKATDPSYFFDTCGGTILLGLRRTVVPAAPDAWIRVLKQFGTRSFAEVAAPAIRYARDGFTVHPMMARFIARYRDQYASFPGERQNMAETRRPATRRGRFAGAKRSGRRANLYGRRGKRAAAGGADRVTALEVARRAFYEGDIAQTIVAYHADHGGWLSREDLAAYRTPVETPLAIDFQGATIYSCRPWCQGPSLLQMLRILDGIDLSALGHNSADYVHTLAETIKLAFADRERYYGDPDVIDVPIDRLLAADYGAARRAMIDPARAFAGLPPAGEIAGFGGVPFSPAPTRRRSRWRPTPLMSRPSTRPATSVQSRRATCPSKARSFRGSGSALRRAARNPSPGPTTPPAWRRANARG